MPVVSVLCVKPQSVQSERQRTAAGGVYDRALATHGGEVSVHRTICLLRAVPGAVLDGDVLNQATMVTQYDRRTVLRRAGTGILWVSLAGCSTPGGEDEEDGGGGGEEEGGGGGYSQEEPKDEKNDECLRRFNRAEARSR